MPALGAESASNASGASRVLVCGPWLWGARRDLWVFGGSALGALALVLLAHAFGFAGGALPEWGFLLFVLGVDVAHVYGTLFRTYFDGAELRARPLRYALTPLFAFALGVAAFSAGPLVFWRVLAYLALFHFVRQEIGWLRLHRAKAHDLRFDARLDELCVYVGALYPVLVWHLGLAERRFSWFVPGDFLAPPANWSAALPLAQVAWLAVLAVFALRQAWLAVDRGVLRALPCLIVAKTALIWYVGIVVCNSDFDFTVTNVVAHGVPYLALLWGYARERGQELRKGPFARFVGFGFLAFFASLLCLAAAEEWGWDRWVFHDRDWLFGDGFELSPRVLRFVVPLLAVPQLTHYLLDAKLWRSSDTLRLPAQRRALGFRA